MQHSRREWKRSESQHDRQPRPEAPVMSSNRRQHQRQRNKTSDCDTKYPKGPRHRPDVRAGRNKIKLNAQKKISDVCAGSEPQRKQGGPLLGLRNDGWLFHTRSVA
ncbi:hypothetical protein QQ054_32590 [Oscillatoria amoena NRMC-F 0135]|nr:hypothetical protein [Oscillatoria amoena NRMC-F 0135]